MQLRTIHKDALKEVCNCLWDTTSEGATLDNDDLERALDLIFSREIKYFEQVLEAITPIQKRCLRGLAALPGTGIYSTSFMEATASLTSGFSSETVGKVWKSHFTQGGLARLPRAGDGDDPVCCSQPLSRLLSDLYGQRAGSGFGSTEWLCSNPVLDKYLTCNPSHFMALVNVRSELDYPVLFSIINTENS